ncbi:N-acetylneuraminate synthase family protein [Streptomyces sp. L7]
MEKFDVPAHKVASASLTDDELLRSLRATGRTVILSTGMSTPKQIRHAVEVLGSDNILMCHATSTYPAQAEELNLRVINTLQAEYPNVPIGYSGHETGLQTTLAAVALGATFVERHITLDRAMWGSDQAASVEPAGPDPPRPRHPHHRGLPRRRRQEGLRVGARPDEEAAPRSPAWSPRRRSAAAAGEPVSV